MDGTFVFHFNYINIDYWIIELTPALVTVL